MSEMPPGEKCAAAAFVPLSGKRTAVEILGGFGLADAEPATLVRQMAFAIEIGDYPGLDRLLARPDAGSEASANASVRDAMDYFRECADAGLLHEAEHGPESARNLEHRFWPEVWERNKRLRAQGYRLAGDGLKS